MPTADNDKSRNAIASAFGKDGANTAYIESNPAKLPTESIGASQTREHRASEPLSVEYAP